MPPVSSRTTSRSTPRSRLGLQRRRVHSAGMRRDRPQVREQAQRLADRRAVPARAAPSPRVGPTSGRRRRRAAPRRRLAGRERRASGSAVPVASIAAPPISASSNVEPEVEPRGRRLEHAHAPAPRLRARCRRPAEHDDAVPSCRCRAVLVARRCRCVAARAGSPARRCRSAGSTARTVSIGNVTAAVGQRRASRSRVDGHVRARVLRRSQRCVVLVDTIGSRPFFSALPRKMSANSCSRPRGSRSRAAPTARARATSRSRSCARHEHLRALRSRACSARIGARLCRRAS